MAMTLPTAEELFGETVRKVSSTPQEWLKFLNTASRVYQYTFDAQLMIYAQRPNAIGCTSFEKWKQMNHYVKRGTQGIALIVRNGENRKLRYVYDYSDTGVASNIPETDIRKPYIWSLGEDGQEDLCDYINNKYNIRPQNKDLGLVLKQLIEETVNDVIDDEISEILKEKQGSYLEDLDIDTIRKEYRELFIHSAWYMLLRRCGVEPGDYMYLEDFRAITDFNNINVISCLGTPVSEQCSFVLKDISRYLWQKNLQKNRAESIVQSNQREYNKDNKTQEQKRGVNRNDVDIHKEGGRTAVSGSGIKGSSEGIHREIRSNESRLSGAASEIKVYGDDDDRGNQSTYDRHSETGRGENGRTDARTDEDSRSNRGTEGSRSDEVGRTRKQLQTAGGGDNQRRDYIQLSLFPENPQEQAEYGTAAGNTPAAVFAFPDNYIDECLRTGGNNELSLEYVLLDLAQENPQKILAKDLKENWKGGKGLAMPDGIKVSVWYNEEGISFRRGNGARKNPERLLSWEEAAERIEILYRNGQFTTRELSENAISTIREETAGLIAFFYKEDMGQSRWGNIHSEAVISIIEELKATASIKKLYDEISLFGTARAGSISQWQEKRCENLAERLYKLGNLSPLVPQNVQEIAPMVFITADEIDRLLQEGGIVEGGKRRILSFYQQEPAPDTKTAINFLKQEYGMGGHSHSISESRNSNEWHDAKGFHLEKGNVQKKLTWKEAEKRIRTLIENKEYPYIHQEAKTETRENVPNFGTQEEKKADTIQFQIDFSEHDILSHYDKEKKAYVTAKMSFAAANRLFAELDEQEMEQQENEGEGYSYYKTAFSIYAIINGEEYSFQGRYDIGSEGKSLIEHIQEYYDYCLSPDCMYRQYWEEDGILEEKIEQLTKYNENFLPYLENHLDLTPVERKQITALIHKEEPEVLQDKKYEIMDTGRIDFPFDVQEWTRENNEFVFSGRNKYCKSRKEASAWIEEQQKESNLIEVAVESSEDYEDIAGSFVTAVDTEGNRKPVYRLIQKGNDGLETYLSETLLFYSEKEAKNYIKSHADEIREISYDEMINWAAEIREDRIAATELQEEILDTDNIAITPVSNDRGQNYHIPKEELGTGTTREKCWKNILAIETVKQLDQEQRKATREEQDILADYVGWGGIADVFDVNRSQWQEERERIHTALTPEEYRSAEESVLNAHYTQPLIIKAMYQVLENMGFSRGRILEPSCGIGNFFGLVPEDMDGSTLYGVELDRMSAKIAGYLYPEANIQNIGFERTNYPDGYFDVAIGNVPFGDYRVNDSVYNSHGFLIHDYFFAKTLDKLRAGGVAAYITTKGTMDKESTKVREFLFKKAELLGAIRLPNTAFKNAGTKVTADILFLQKREKEIENPEWIAVTEDAQGFRINSYFVQHPEMILGTMQEISGPYGMETTCVEKEGVPLGERLRAAISHITGHIPERVEEERAEFRYGEEQQADAPNASEVRMYSYVLSDTGEVYYKNESGLEQKETAKTAKARITGMVAIRDCVRELIRLQMEETEDADTKISAEQARLNALYDSYTAKWGLLNSTANKRAFSEDSSYPLLCSLEKLDEDGNLDRKADMFTKRTIRKSETITHVDTANEALAVSLEENGKVDLAFMSGLCGKSAEQITEELTGVIVYDALKEKLMQKGVPEQEIAFIHDANTDVQKAKLFTKVRSGQVRFLLGSTSKMGAGTNVQDKLIALHHLDVPWRPADIEQQEGRILRQGNQNEKVKIFRYITENTFDAYSWQLIENKQKFIGQIMTSKSPVRSCQDVDEAALSYAEVKALATGNPKIKEKMDLDIQVTKLKMLKANYESNLFRLQDAIAVEYPQQIAKYEELTAAYEADIAHLDTAMNTPFSMEIHGITYDNEKTAGEILVQACTKMKKEHTDAADIGTFKGFKMKVSYSLFDNSFYVKLTRESSVTVEVKKDPVRNIERILTALRKMPGQKDVAEERLEGARQQLVQAKEEVNKPFEKENELRSVQERLTKINAELDMKPKEEPKKMIKKEELKKCL